MHYIATPHNTIKRVLFTIENISSRSVRTVPRSNRNNSKHKHSTTNTSSKGAARKATFFEDNMKHNSTHRPAIATGPVANQPASQCKENVAAPMKKANFTSRDTAAKSRNTNPHHNHHHHMKHYQPGRVSPRSPMSYVSPVGVSLSSPNTAFFASSKYLDAPSPKTLPAPPTKWITQEPPKRQLFDGSVAVKVAAAKLVAAPAISCSLASAAEVAGRSLCSDIFSQNLKLMLNVQS